MNRSLSVVRFNTAPAWVVTMACSCSKHLTPVTIPNSCLLTWKKRTLRIRVSDDFYNEVGNLNIDKTRQHWKCWLEIQRTKMRTLKTKQKIKTTRRMREWGPSFEQCWDKIKGSGRTKRSLREWGPSFEQCWDPTLRAFHCCSQPLSGRQEHQTLSPVNQNEH